LARRGLIVSYYFPPTGGGGVQRWLKLIKYLSRLDWCFTVISSSHDTINPQDSTLLEEIPENTRLIPLPETAAHPVFRSVPSFLRKSGYWQRWVSAFINITDSRMSWNKKAKNYLLHELQNNKYDTVILTSPPYSLALLAAELTDEVNIPVILDLRDPWTINPYKIYPTAWHLKSDRRREEKAIAKIAAIISAYQSTVDDYNNRIPGFKDKPVLVLPNGYDEADFSGLNQSPQKMSEDFNIGFSGSLYSHLNTPGALFAAIAALKKENISVKFHHIGTSVYNLRTLAEKYDITENITEWGYRTHAACLEILQQMDAFCLLLDDHWPNSRYTVGGKFYEYLRLRKPVLAIVPDEGEAAALIRETDCGIVASAADATEVITAIKKLIDKEIPFAWKNLDKFNRENQAEQLVTFLDQQILGRRGKGKG
jgi:glycosyltransferase involved in cell wall biosynthesis